MENNTETVDKIKTRVVGIDIRVEKTTFAVVDIRGEIIAQDHFATLDYKDINDYINALCEKVVTLVEEMEVMRRSVLLVSVHPVPVLLQAVLRMPLICLGRV